MTDLIDQEALKAKMRQQKAVIDLMMTVCEGQSVEFHHGVHAYAQALHEAGYRIVKDEGQ